MQLFFLFIFKGICLFNAFLIYRIAGPFMKADSCSDNDHFLFASNCRNNIVVVNMYDLHDVPPFTTAIAVILFPVTFATLAAKQMPGYLPPIHSSIHPLQDDKRTAFVIVVHLQNPCHTQ